jgi:uncharacterized membrane protein
MRARLASSCRGDEGSLIPLILFYFVVAATLVLVVADASKVYLARRSLQSAADGAALASAQSASLQGLYAGAQAGALQLDGDACAATRQYALDNDLAAHFDALQLAGYAQDDPDTCDATGAAYVTVVASDQVHVPLVSILGVVAPKYAKGVPLTVIAHAALVCGTC